MSTKFKLWKVVYKSNVDGSKKTAYCSMEDLPKELVKQTLQERYGDKNAIVVECDD